MNVKIRKSGGITIRLTRVETETLRAIAGKGTHEHAQLYWDVIRILHRKMIRKCR